MNTTKLKDIAEAAGVSIGTVSRALTGKTKGYRSDAAVQMERIQALAKKMNYQPNKAAQVMRTRRTFQIGVIAHSIDNPYTSRMMNIVDEELSKRGYGLLLKLLPGKKEQVLEQLGDFSMNLLDGVINHHPLIEGSELEECITRVPTVTFDRSPEYSPAIKNMESGVLMALQHLWSLGHRRIALLCGSLRGRDRSRRVQAYENFYASHQHAIDAGWILSPGWTYEDGETAVDDFLATGCTACLGGNDLLGVALCTALRMKGYEVPRDYSIVAMDDTILTRINRPQLTTLRPPVRTLISLTIDGLLAKIESREPPEFQLLMPELVVRDSTGPVKA